LFLTVKAMLALALAAFAVLAEATSNSSLTLEKVIILSRHGIRTP
jgi:hypothetical protein